MNLGQVLRSGLASLGVETFYGSPMDGLDVVTVPAPWMGPLLRVANHELGGSAASIAETSDGWRLVIGGEGGVEGSADVAPAATLVAAADVRGLLEVVAAGSARSEAVVVDVVADLSMPVDQAVVQAVSAPFAPWAGAPDVSAETCEAVRASKRPVLLVGPGVLERGSVAWLHATASSLDCGVLNTWGAKGVFDWRSPHHYATVGLQQRDLELGCPDDADLVVTSGLTAVVASELSCAIGSVDVLPDGLAALAPTLRDRPARGVGAGTVEMPPLRTQLAAVTQRGWAHTGARVMPTQVTRNYGQWSGGLGLVTADPGVAGYWVARTFPTTRLGEALVPETAAHRGFALACALVAAQRELDRPVLVAADGPLDERGSALLDWARETRTPVVVEVWEDDGPAVGTDEHAARLARSWSAAVEGREPIVVHVAPDSAQLEEMIGVAGPVTAWGGVGAR